MNWMIVLAACGGSPPPEPPSHATGFPHLVRAVIANDADAAAQWSEDLLPTGTDNTDAALTIGASKGMLAMAADADERRAALVGIARGCSGCHVAEDVLPSSYQPLDDAELDSALKRAVFAGESGLDALLQSRQRAEP